MNKKFACIFDLDGTLYPKKSDITAYMRKMVIDYIAKKKI